MTVETIPTKQGSNEKQLPDGALTKRDIEIDTIATITSEHSGLHEGQKGWKRSEEEEYFKEDPYSNS
jgi:hypothetical protein